MKRKYRYRVTILDHNNSLMIAYEFKKSSCELWLMVSDNVLCFTCYDLLKRRYIKL